MTRYDPDIRPTCPLGGKVLICPRIKSKQHICQSRLNSPSSRQLTATRTGYVLTPHLQVGVLSETGREKPQTHGEDHITVY